MFIGPPLFWPWYYPPAYYYPPTYYYPPPTVYAPPTTIYYPPPAVTPSSPTYYPQTAAPNPSASAVIELPNNEPSQQSAPPQQSSPPQSSSARPQPGSVVAQVPAKQLFMYPKQGQSAEQQTRDRDECYRWAMGQVGGDPSQISGRLSQAQTSDYYRAMEACLDAHGYSVR